MGMEWVQGVENGSKGSGTVSATDLTAGKIKTKHDIAKGDVDIFPETLLRLFRGANFGKLMIQLPEQRIET